MLKERAAVLRSIEEVKQSVCHECKQCCQQCTAADVDNVGAGPGQKKS